MPSARTIFQFVLNIPRMILVGMVRVYQLILSPHIGAACRFQPTCSHYSIEALRKYGAVKGTILTVYRIGRCHPWGGHGYDPPRWFGERGADGSHQEAGSTTRSAISSDDR